MLMDPMGGIVMTNDGNAILREVRGGGRDGEHAREGVEGMVNMPERVVEDSEHARV